MSYGRVFETIDGEMQEIEVLELMRKGAEVARNSARTHGLTAELAPKSVLEWYRIILNNPTAELPLTDTLRDQQRLALNLAQGEVRLRDVLHSIDEFEQERDPFFEERANQEHDYQLYLRFARNRSLDKWTRDASKILLRIISQDIRKGQRQIETRARLLQRYKREAQSKQPGLTNSKRTKSANPETKFTTTKRRNIHI